MNPDTDQTAEPQNRWVLCWAQIDDGQTSGDQGDLE